MELINKFTPLDKIFQTTNSLGDNKVLEILTEHRNLEARYVTDDSNQTPLEIPLLGENFHKENLETIDYIIENLDIGIQKLDALFYLYPFLICRYSNAGRERFPAVERFQHYLTTLHLVFNTRDFNITFLSSILTRFFYSRDNSIYLHEIIESIASVNDNNSLLVYHCCRALLYDREFCSSVYPYEVTMHRGAYILFDIIINKVLWGRSKDKQEWINKRVNFFEKNKEIQFDSMPEYYLLLAKLFKCFYLSFEKKDYQNELNDLEIIKLPDFKIKGDITNLYFLYVLKLTCLENFNENKKIIKMCDYLLQIFGKSDKERHAYYIQSINWRKYNALKSTSNNEHIKWYFETISGYTLEKIKNNVYLSPFMEQNDSPKDLYHFTNLEALKSVIENKNLWLTRYDFLNDTKEIRYITEIIKNNIDNLQNNDVSFIDFIRGCLEILDGYFADKPDGIILSAIKNCISNVYVLSTSVKEDNLSLWHYYSSGTGCSIKISTEELHNQIKQRNTYVFNKEAQVFMREINYTVDFSKSSLIETLKTIYDNDVLGLDVRKFLACVHIIYEGIFTKNPNMSQEQEFRVAVIVSNSNESEFTSNKLSPKFRVNKNTFIPYIELSIDSQTLIKEICIAPLNKTDIAKKGLKEFLKNKNFYCDLEIIKVSEIELRY